MASRLNRAKTVQAARRAARSKERPKPRRWTLASARRARQVAEGPSGVGSGARRIRLVLLGFGLASLVLLGQAVRLQIVDHRRLRQVAFQQATATSTLTAKRGAIRDRNGSALAITVDVDSVYFEWVRGQRRARPDEVARLAELLGRSTIEIAERLGSDRPFVYLARRVDAETAERVAELAIPGVRTQPEHKRFYANVDLAAHVLGFTNVDGEGRAGIERRFDTQLQGRREVVTGLRDALGTPIYSRGAVQQVALRGADIELTLDRHIQFAAEQALAEAVTAHAAKSGVAIVMAPKTGDVLAMASYPQFNPNNLRDTTVSQRTNRAVNAVYEPGSTLKMVTVAAALEEKLIRPDTVLHCEDGRWEIGNEAIHDANHRYGDLTISEVIQKSSNICAAKIGFRLGRRRLHDWLIRFGLGTRTGIELPGELRGLLRPARRWSDIGLANIAFGQGVSATPIQLVQAAATLANDGVRVAPRLVRAVVDAHGVKTEVPRPDPERVISASTARAVARMMTSVTEPGGTAPGAAIPGFRVAGKTGTAQKIDPVTRAYSHELYVASFVGFAPVEDPQFVVLVLIDEPKQSIFGGVVAGPAWQKITVAALAARDLRPHDPSAWRTFLTRRAALPRLPPPVAPAEVVNGEAAPWIDETAEVAEAPDALSGLDMQLSQKALRLLGLAGTSTGTNSGDPDDRMPNFARLTLREVLNRAADTRCDLVVDGSGRVVEQQPPAGAALAPDARCALTLAPRR